MEYKIEKQQYSKWFAGLKNQRQQRGLDLPVVHRDACAGHVFHRFRACFFHRSGLLFISAKDAGWPWTYTASGRCAAREARTSTSLLPHTAIFPPFPSANRSPQTGEPLSMPPACPCVHGQYISSNGITPAMGETKKAASRQGSGLMVFCWRLLKEELDHGDHCQGIETISITSYHFTSLFNCCISAKIFDGSAICLAISACIFSISPGVIGAASNVLPLIILLYAFSHTWSGGNFRKKLIR